MAAGELARYSVRTPLALWIANGVLTGVTVLLLAALVIYDRAPWFVVVLLLGMGAASVAFWTSMSAYRVGATRNLIRIYQDRLEVPAVNKRAPLVFARAGLKLQIHDVTMNYRFGFRTVARVSRGKLIELSDGTQTRKLSTLTLEDEADAPALLADLGRFLAGEPALGRAAHDAPPPRTEYDDILDRELAKVE